MSGSKEVFGGMAGVPLSGAVRAGDYVHVSGQLPFGPDGKLIDGDAGEQTRAVMERIKSLLEEAGASMEQVVKCTCWLVNVIDFQAFNAVYAEYFPTDPPARATVRAELMLDALVEVDAIAYSPR